MSGAADGLGPPALDHDPLFPYAVEQGTSPQLLLSTEGLRGLARFLDICGNL